MNLNLCRIPGCHTYIARDRTTCVAHEPKAKARRPQQRRPKAAKGKATR